MIQVTSKVTKARLVDAPPFKPESSKYLPDTEYREFRAEITLENGIFFRSPVVLRAIKDGKVSYKNTGKFIKEEPFGLELTIYTGDTITVTGQLKDRRLTHVKLL